MSLTVDVQAEDFVLAKEQTILETYFYALGKFSYDKSKEVVEKERDSIHKSHQTTAVYSSFLTALSQLATAERNYTALMFLVPKGFLRKDSSLKAMYEALKTEFLRLEDRSKETPSPIPSPMPSLSNEMIPIPSPTPSFVSFISRTTSFSSQSSTDSSWNQSSQSVTPRHLMDLLDKLAGHLSTHLVHFVMARLETMDFYDKLYSASLVRFIKYDELLISLNDILCRSQKYFHHPLLSTLKTTFNFECEILHKLLEVQFQLQQWQFLPSLLQLHDANLKLVSWAAATISKETRRPYTIVVRPSPPPVLCQWLTKLKSLLVSKFTLYFHEILSQQTTSQDMKSLCTKNSVDLYQKMINFHRKSDALYLAIVLETFGLENYKGHGYHHPDKYYEPPKGLDSYPAVVCYPNEKPSSHWPSIIMIISDKARELNNSDQAICFYDKQVHTTYFLIRIEPRMILTAIFEGRRSERDSTIISFLQEFCSQLQCNKLFISLKSGSKP